jgi:hypothetical protein
MRWRDKRKKKKERKWKKVRHEKEDNKKMEV